MLGMLGGFRQNFALWFSQPGQGKFTPVQNPERRQFARLACRTRIRFESATGGPSDTNTAQVADISPGGVRLLVEQPWEKGSLLHLALPASSATSPENLLVCVIHAQAEQEHWSLGCSFIRELTSQELHAFQ